MNELLEQQELDHFSDHSIFVQGVYFFKGIFLHKKDSLKVEKKLNHKRKEYNQVYISHLKTRIFIFVCYHLDIVPVTILLLLEICLPYTCELSQVLNYRLFLFTGTQQKNLFPPHRQFKRNVIACQNDQTLGLLQGSLHFLLFNRHFNGNQ